METIDVVIGRIGKPHGIRGEVTVEVRTDEPDRRFVVGGAVRAERPSGAGTRPGPTLTVAATRWHQTTLLVRFEELPDRTTAEAARGLLLHADVPADESPEDPEEFYDHQLVGLAAEDLDGRPLGEVTAVLHGAQDLLQVRALDGRDALVPFVAALVPEVDVPAGRVVIADRPGLVTAFPEDDGVVRIDVVTIFPDVVRLPRRLAHRQGPHVRAARHRRPRPARLDARPAPHRRRHAVRRRRRHGDEARAVGRGARRAGLDRLDRRPARDRRSSVPTPSGRPFTQAVARELATRDHLVLACGRYEGIDQRVVDDAATSYDVQELSLGDFVLNGGEVAALAFIEAVVRLLPGFMGNPESLAEESHEDGLLEYPVYTKPASWRGHDVPPVLLSGDHAAIAAWRRAESVRRTVARRPDLAHPAARVGLGEPRPRRRPGDPRRRGRALHPDPRLLAAGAVGQPRGADPGAAGVVRRPRRSLDEWTTFVARAGGRLVGSSRGRAEGDVWDVGRVMVAPDLQGRGLGRYLLTLIEDAAPAEVTSYQLFTGAGSVDNIRMYKKAGYRLRGPAPGAEGAVLMTKPRR